MVDSSELKFTEEETNLFYELTNLYPSVKELILYGEEVDPEHRSHLQSINELRNAMDHLMRVFGYKFNLKKDVGSEYSRKNIDKAFGHVYRAGYDALDWLNITVRERITKELEGVSHEAILEVFPEYYREIKPKIEKTSDEVSDIRVGKDVTGDEVQTGKFENFEQYIEVVRELKGSLDKIIEIKPSLLECEKERKKKEKKELAIRILLVLISVVGGSLVTLYLTTFFGT